MKNEWLKYPKTGESLGIPETEKEPYTRLGRHNSQGRTCLASMRT